VAIFPAFAARGQNLVRKITAGNPASVTNKVVIREFLPSGIGRAEVIDPAGMEVKYERVRGAYYLYAEESLPPAGTIEYNVILKDIWTIPQEEIDGLRNQAAEVAKELMKTDVRESAATLKREADEFIAQVEERQGKYKIGGAVTAAAHIKSFEKTQELYNKAREKVGELENQANTYVIKLNRMLGPLPELPERERIQNAGAIPGKFVVEARNTSGHDAPVAVVKYLPQEVGPEDVIPEGDLEVRYDSDRGACYLYSTGIPVKAGETVSIPVTVANRWTIDPQRYAYLYDRLTNLQAVGKIARIEYVENEATRLLPVLADYRNAEVPAALDDAYIINFREKSRALDLLEREIMRLSRVLKPENKPQIFQSDILNVQPPSRQTTWRIIYVVLAFLAVVSILFFLRWYGKSKDETLGG